MTEGGYPAVMVSTPLLFNTSRFVNQNNTTFRGANCLCITNKVEWKPKQNPDANRCGLDCQGLSFPWADRAPHLIVSLPPLHTNTPYYTTPDKTNRLLGYQEAMPRRKGGMLCNIEPLLDTDGIEIAYSNQQYLHVYYKISFLNKYLWYNTKFIYLFGPFSVIIIG